MHMEYATEKQRNVTEDPVWQLESHIHFWPALQKDVKEAEELWLWQKEWETLGVWEDSDRERMEWLRVRGSSKDGNFWIKKWFLWICLKTRTQTQINAFENTYTLTQILTYTDLAHKTFTHMHVHRVAHMHIQYMHTLSTPSHTSSHLYIHMCTHTFRCACIVCVCEPRHVCVHAYTQA